MHHSSNFRQRAIKACVLGIGALIINVISLHHLPGHNLPLGDIFLFLVAAGFHPLATLAAGLIAEIPLILSNSHQLLHGLQFVIFLVSFSCFINKFPQIPVNFIFIPLWIIVALLIAPFSETTLNQYLLWFCANLTLFGFSRLLLLSSPVASFIYSRLPRLTLPSLIPEILSIFVVFLVGLLIFQKPDERFIIEIAVNDYGLIVPSAFAIMALMAPLLGTMLTSTILNEYGPDIQAYLKSSYKPFEFKFTRKNRLPSSATSEETPRPAFDSSAEKSIIAIGSDDSIAYISAKAAEILEMTAYQSSIGKPVTSLPTSAEISKKLSSLVEIARTKGKFSEEIRMEGFDEFSHKFLKVSFEPEALNSLENTFDQNFKSGVVITIKDISNQRIIGRSHLETKRRENLGFIAAGVSHAFADALTATQTLSGMGLRGKTSEEKDEAFRLILQVSESVDLLVQQLIEFSESHPGSRRDEDIKEIIEERIEFFRQTVGETVTIDLKVCSQPTKVSVNTILLIQALSHLIINAKESYLEQGGHIELSIDTEEIDEELANVQPGAYPGKYVRVRIKDFGQGMNADTLNHAFDPLYTTKSGHSGIGLSVVFGVIRAHDGFLTVESAQDKGTSVSLYIPLIAN